MADILHSALQILKNPEAVGKAEQALALDLVDIDELQIAACKQFPAPPDHPARPNSAVLPTAVKKRKPGTAAGRVALLHAVAHIELNAIDLAFDMIARFAGAAEIAPEWRAEFVADWVSVGQDEARHFSLLNGILINRGKAYGALPVHSGMWDAARNTSDKVLARLAIAPMVLEARGLDVTPPMLDKLNSAGDEEAVKALQVIYSEEVAHVATGVKWFVRIAKSQGHDPKILFHELVRERFPGGLKPPFNDEARQRAGLHSDFYRELAANHPIQA